MRAMLRGAKGVVLLPKVVLKDVLEVHSPLTHPVLE